jgi:hypothetical protein
LLFIELPPNVVRFGDVECLWSRRRNPRVPTPTRVIEKTSEEVLRNADGDMAKVYTGYYVDLNIVEGFSLQGPSHCDLQCKIKTGSMRPRRYSLLTSSIRHCYSPFPKVIPSA